MGEAMTEKPQILESKVVAESRLFQIERVHLTFSNSQERHFERIRGRSKMSIMIIPMLDDDTMLLVREYGVGLEDYYLSFPTGAVEKNEDILIAADRELKEEVGYGAREYTELKTLRSSPGYTTGVMRVMVARELYPEKLIGDEPEPLEVVTWPLSDYKNLISREDFPDSKSIAAIYLLREYLNG